jgi:hypothetical protein
MSPIPPKSHSDKFIRIMSQNVTFTVNKEEELVNLVAKKRELWAACLQETHREVSSQTKKNGFLIINHSSGTPGSGGVGIVLSPDAQECWGKHDRHMQTFGNRILAIKLQTTDTEGRPISIYLISAYAPDSGKPVQDFTMFLDNLDECLSKASDPKMTSLCLGQI